MFQNKVILISPSLHLKTNRIQFSFPEEPLATREWAREQFYSVESFFWHIYLPEIYIISTITSIRHYVNVNVNVNRH